MVVTKHFPVEEIDYNYLKSFLSEYKNVRVKINDMLKKKEIVRIKKGLYVLGKPYSKSLFYKETLSNLIYGPSYISLEYALSFYGMIPEKVQIVTAVTNKRNKVFDTPLGRFSYRYINTSLYPEGIDLIELDETHNVLIASKEKAVADTLYFADRFQNTNELKSYLFDSLRIGQSEVKKLSVNKIKRLAKIYGGNILILQKYLTEEK
ncbi:MAG: type IV toxin-antitoxin system AbiEi family antitoxin domain-containing protein [bacterium]